MKKVLINILKVNLFVCAGVLIADMYGKVCDIHKNIKG